MKISQFYPPVEFGWAFSKYSYFGMGFFLMAIPVFILLEFYGTDTGDAKYLPLIGLGITFIPIRDKTK